MSNSETWAVGDDRVGLGSDEIPIIDTATGAVVCACWQIGEDFDGENGNANMVTNARKIAAAPELLEACRTFALWLEREENGFKQPRETPEDEARWRDWYHENLRVCDLAQVQARAAIAKAEGRS